MSDWRVLSCGSTSEEQVTVARGSRRPRTRDDGAVRTGAVLTVVVGVGVGMLPTAAAGHAASEPTFTIEAFPVSAGSGPHDVSPAVDGGVWFTAQDAGELGLLDPVTGASRMI